MKKMIVTAFVVVAGIFSANAQDAKAADTAKQADLIFVSETHDFGGIPQGVPASYTFEVKNTGKAPLTITNAQASCGCTTPEWSKEPIKPGKKGFVKATYNAANVGTFNKAVTVTSNGKRGNVILYLKGEVKAAEKEAPAAKPAE